jgi:hypothetical protein
MDDSEPPDSPLVQQYLAAFAELVRVVASDQDVPETLWETIRAAWADMSPAERETVEKRTRRDT